MALPTSCILIEYYNVVTMNQTNSQRKLKWNIVVELPVFISIVMDYPIIGKNRHLLCELHSEKNAFDFIGVGESYRCDGDTRLRLPGYHDLISRCRTDGSRGGVGLFKDNIQYKIRQDLSVFEQHVFKSVFVEVESQSGSNLFVGVIHRPIVYIVS